MIFNIFIKDKFENMLTFKEKYNNANLLSVRYESNCVTSNAMII